MDSLKAHIANRGALKRISEISGVDQSTISRIARGVTKNPGIQTVKSIESACEEYEQETEKKQSASRDNQDSAVVKPGA